MSDWPEGFRVTLPRSGPGVHQIRLYQNSRGSHSAAKRSDLIVACVCGAELGHIEPGGDCWTLFRAHDSQAAASTLEPTEFWTGKTPDPHHLTAPGNGGWADDQAGPR